MIAAESEDTMPSVQEQIEILMKMFSEEGRWESAFLFSSDGLLMARQGDSTDYRQERLTEYMFSMMETVHLLEDDHEVREIVLRGMHRKYLVFRFFDAWNELAVLAVVTSGRKGYRRALGKLIRTIQELD